MKHAAPCTDGMNGQAPPNSNNTSDFDHNFRSPTPDVPEPFTTGLDAKIEDLRITAEFIEGLQTATLEKSNMHEDDIQCLHEAP